MQPTSVSCHCGSVKVSLSAEPVAHLYCHCRDCQRISGGAYVPYVIYPQDAVEVTEGETLTWALKNNPRTRCAACGTLLFGQPPGMGVRGIIAHLTPPGTFQPQMHIQCHEAVLPVVDDLPHYKGFPASFGGSDDQVDW